MSAAHPRRPLRIAYPISHLQIGGAEMRMLTLVERLPRDRFEVDFISLVGEGPLDDRGLAAGARVHHLGDSALFSEPLVKRAVGRLGKLRRYARLARKRHYDIVDAWLYPTDVFAALGRNVTGTPIVMSGRADLLPRAAFGPLSGQVDRIVNRRLDAIVANSDAVAAANRGRYGVDASKLHVIHNGVELIEPVAIEERRRLRSFLGAGDDQVLIGSVGMLREVKRHSLLIDAFADVARTHSEVRLTIIGEGPMRPQLERQIDHQGLGSRVTLPGAIVNIRPMFDALDVVALSSRSEGFPNALLEAAAAAKPIVTTAAGGAVEIVIDGVTGLVVPVEDGEALTVALTRIATDRDLCVRFGAEAREYVSAAFGMQRFVDEWCQLYERLADSKKLTPT